MNRGWILLLILSLFWGTTIAQPVEVGWIESIKGDSNKTRIERQGKYLAPRILMPIQKDDRIFLDDNNSSVKLQIGNQSVSLKASDSPFTVRNDGNEASIPGNLLGWVSSLLADDDKDQLLQTVSAVSRGQGTRIQAPLFGFVGKTIHQRKILELAWRDGTPPFRVRLLASSEKTELRNVQELETRTLSLDMSDITPGRYEIEISDTRIQNSYRLEIIPAADTTKTNFRPAVYDTLKALELIEEDSDSWLLEAYQLVSKHADNYPPARLLRDRLR